MGTLQIIFFGLCAFFGAGQDPRMVIVLDVSRGEKVHGHVVQPHAAFIRVRRIDVDSETNWPPRYDDKGYAYFKLDNRTLEISEIDDSPLRVDPSHSRLVPHILKECPDLAEPKDDATLKSAAAANIVLSYGTLCAHQKDGAVSSVYAVRTTGDTATITAKRAHDDHRILVLRANAVIEIRNEPVEEMEGNHFIAFYKQIAKNDACCTNLPYRKIEDKDEGCDLPGGAKEVSTVACSNSNYP